MLIIDSCIIEIDTVTNHARIIRTQPYDDGYDEYYRYIYFYLLFYKYSWYTGYKSTCMNVLINLLCLPLDLIKFLLTLPFCVIFNIIQCIWSSSSTVYYLGNQSLNRIDNWLASPPRPVVEVPVPGPGPVPVPI